MTFDTDLVHHFAKSVAHTTFDQLSESAREAAKKSMLDTLGVILAASGMEPAVRGIIEIVEEAGGTKEATKIGFGGQAPAIMAALANGALAHCLDYDDQTPWGQHCSSSIVPAVMAVAERRGGITGKEMITAVAVGQDIFARLRTNVGWLKDWNLSTVLAVFGATAAAARAYGLDEKQIGHALGIASMQSSGIMEMIAGRGSDLRGMYAGFSSKGAVLATLMASKGTTGIDKMFEGQYGFFNSYFGGRYDRDKILADLGSNFLGEGTLYKRWPCVGTAHSHMKAAIDIITENNVALSDIETIKLHVGDYHDLMCQPMAERCAPATLADAKFSLPFLVATAIVRNGMSVSDFTAAGLKDTAVLNVAAKMELVNDPKLNWTLELPPGRVEITLKDGRSWLAVGTHVPGNADAPMDWDQVIAKFTECASVSAEPISTDRISTAAKLAQHLEEATDATQLIKLLG
ncbi:MmgE/PrpD family protein [Donghicola mangrovi]|uniref:MmgE/PrpD family protein n=1 Tax=Donghicola mangrovi TaxID=2729614 RepID=A0A850Q8Z6_9RHOB|nr:MmgE/PrpD family protein [Donghicola mangrovi]NVO25423.1 MmgE/PrpD family protein [Donghicola mangrovi]